MKGRLERRQVISNPGLFGKVAVLYGGNSSEREVSLMSGQAVFDALVSRGVDAQLWDPAERGVEGLADVGIDRAGVR